MKFYQGMPRKLERFKLNPRLPEPFSQALIELWKHDLLLRYPKHYGILSSGTSGTQYRKIILLSDEAIETAALSFAKHFEMSAKDISLVSIPTFHIGGLMIHARAHVSGSLVMEHDLSLGWNPRKFVEVLQSHHVTICSLVPTQAFDIATHNLIAPSSLRLAFVGGAALDKTLHEKLLALGWPVRVSYGMTETCAMVACADASMERQLYALPHAKIDIDAHSQILSITSKALLSAQVHVNELGMRVSESDPKIEEHTFVTEDLGFWHGNDNGDKKSFDVLGRSIEVVKVSGELVHLGQLNQVLQALPQKQSYPHDLAIVSVPDDRQGSRVVLAVPDQITFDANTLRGIQEAFNAKVMPFERIQEIWICDAIFRTELSKLRLEKTQQSLRFHLKTH